MLERNPFETIDQAGVGELMRIAVERGRGAKEGMKMGICGEHGGEPDSIAFCHGLGLDYVSCSPYRVPLARLAAAQAALDGVGRRGRRSPAADTFGHDRIGASVRRPLTAGEALVADAPLIYRSEWLLLVLASAVAFIVVRSGAARRRTLANRETLTEAVQRGAEGRSRARSRQCAALARARRHGLAELERNT